MVDDGALDHAPRLPAPPLRGGRPLRRRSASTGTSSPASTSRTPAGASSHVLIGHVPVPGPGLSGADTLWTTLRTWSRIAGSPFTFRPPTDMTRGQTPDVAARDGARARWSPRRRRTGAGRTSRSRRDLEARLLEQAAPVLGGEPGERHRGLGRRRRARAGSRRGAPGPSRPAPRCPARARASGRASPRCPPGSARRRRRRGARRAPGARTRPRAPRGASSSRLQVEQRAERRGDEPDPLGHGRVAQVARGAGRAGARPRPPPPAAGTPRASRPRSRRRSRGTPADAIGTAIRPVPTPSSTTGPPARGPPST